ncbi:MAG TPA: alpha/beta hydrolase [Mycobacteriales bacterium]|nr:alpha/beta hydrolase [Mycobacteriales bacterium]
MVESRCWDVVTDDGVRLEVETWPARRPDAPLVLGIHGIAANRRAFLPLIAALDGDVEFVAFDCRGRGGSDKPADPARYGHGRHALDAACVLAAAGRRADALMGQSMGAWNGLLLAADRPDLVGALVLGDGGYFTDLPDGVEPAAYVESVMGAGWSQRLAMVVPSREMLVTALRSAPPYRDLWGPDLEAMFDHGLETLPDGSVRNRCSVEGVVFDSTDYFTPREAPYVRAALPRVTCPVHLVRAERGFDLSPETREPLLPTAAVEEFRRALPQLVVETVPDTTHYTVNFGPAGVVALAEAIRKAVR